MADQQPKLPNPRGGKRPPDRRLTPRRGPGFALWYVLAFFLLLAIGQAFFYSLQSGETIPYSQFKSHVSAGRVQEVTVSQDRIRGTLSVEGGAKQPFNTVRVEDPKLVEELIEQFLDKQSVSF